MCYASILIKIIKYCINVLYVVLEMHIANLSLNMNGDDYILHSWSCSKFIRLENYFLHNYIHSFTCLTWNILFSGW